MALNLYKIDNGTYEPMSINYDNINGTPIVDVRLSGSNNQIAGIYHLTFTNVNAGSTATLIVDALEPKNPYENLTGIPITLDGSTWQEVIPGVEAQFSNSTSFVDTWEAKVYIGAYRDGTGNDVRVLTFDIVVAGTSSTEQRVAVRNDGSDLEAECKVYIVNGVRYENVGSEGLSAIYTTEVNPVKTAGASSYYTMTITDNGDGTCNISINGNNYDILDTGTGVTYTSGFNVPVNTSKIYEIQAGNLAGVRFQLTTLTANATVYIYVSDASEHIYFAEDNNGAAGTYQLAENNFITITADGHPTTGEIPAGSTAFFWVKVNPTTSATKDHNERYANIVIKSLGV